MGVETEQIAIRASTTRCATRDGDRSHLGVERVSQREHHLPRLLHLNPKTQYPLCFSSAVTLSMYVVPLVVRPTRSIVAFFFLLLNWGFQIDLK